MTSPAAGVSHRFLFPLLAVSITAGALPALAQTTVPEAQPETGQGVVPEATPQAPSNETLTDKLEDTRGIIEPQRNVDPGMTMPPPDDGTAAGRVIEPPPVNGQGVVPEATPQASPNETLSDRLEDTRGIIEPQRNVDPEMTMPPPDDGSAAGRVIEPPPVGAPPQ